MVDIAADGKRGGFQFEKAYCNYVYCVFPSAGEFIIASHW
jgi:hypothetical protein